MNAKDKALLAPLASTGNSHTIICQENWNNGQTTRESHRYTAREMLETFTRTELEMLGEGLVITKGATWKGGPITKLVSAEALAAAAIKKAVR